MKCWWGRFGIAVATFALGCLVYFLSAPERAPLLDDFVPFAYCEVARNAEQYHNRDLIVRARIIFDESGVYVYEDCDPTEALAASVVLAENPAHRPGIRREAAGRRPADATKDCRSHN